MALLGQLTVGILGDLSGYSDTMSKAQKETLRFSKKLEQTGKNISTIGYGFQDLGSKLTKMITVPALAAGTAVAGITLKKGWDRLMGIDTAQAKLKALGHDGKSVDLIMESALTSVKGTSFGLGEAATTAANAVAAGVKPGEELTRYLILAGDAAAVAGTDLSEMGSVLNKVQTSNKAYNGELQQLSDRGLPIYQWLADEANTTADAIFDMASSGEVSSKMLLDAIEKNIGGAAGIMGAESMAAGMENVWAAVGRLGASFLDAGGEAGGFFSTVKPLMVDFIEYIDGFGDVAAQMGVKFGQAFNSIIDKIRDVKQWYDDLSPSIQNLIQKVTIFGSIGAVALGPFLLVIGKVIVGIGNLVSRIGVITAAVTRLGGVFGILTGPIGITIGIIASLIAIGVLLVKNWDKIKATAQSVFPSIEPSINILKQAFTTLLSHVNPIINNLKNIWMGLQPVFSLVGKVIMAVLVAITGAITVAFTTITATIGPVLNVITSAVSVITNALGLVISLIEGDWTGAWEHLKNIGEGVLNVLVGSLEAVVTFIGSFVSSIVNFFYSLYMTLVGNSIVPDMVNAIVEWFQNLFQWLFDIVEMIVNAVVNGFNFMKNLIENITELIVGIIEAGWSFIKEIVGIYLDLLIALITGDFESMNGIIDRLTNTAKNLISNIWSAIDSFLSKTLGNMWTNTKNKFTDIKDSVQSKTKEAKDKLVENFNTMVSNVKNKAGEILDTVNEKFSAAKDKITQPIKDAKDLIKGYIDDIKGFFSNLKLKIPTPELPKLPTFTTTGGSGIIPKIGVKWNAMGGIFKNPTIFNTANAGLQGVGEAGAEAIIPLRSNILSAIGDAIAQNMSQEEVETSTVIQIENMNVRDEYDIQRIAKELDDLTRTKERQRGVVRFR